MSLKQSIVIVNEFSTKTRSGGTRGGTPGDYVLRYMARKGATEDVAPVRLFDGEEYIQKYMARKEATEVLDRLSEVKETMETERGLGGVAFGVSGKGDVGDVSMSDRKIRQVSKQIQEQFLQNKTVFKTVLSFDEAYLKEHGIVDKEFSLTKAGDYRGNIDQMRLRVAILDGMKKVSKTFDDLAWVGVIQVDTKHVHAHLTMVDQGVGHIIQQGKYKGQQRGMLVEEQKRMLRRAMDQSLDETKMISLMASNVTYDRRNLRCFLKKFTHEVMDERGFAQFLLATLPADERLWRAGTNRREMQKPNALVREYVEEVFRHPDSGYDQAMADIGRYASERATREGLSDKEHRLLLTNGRKRLVEDSMNGVYQVLKDLPEEEKKIRTPMLDVMGMDFELMAEEARKVDPEPMIEFGFKLRSYASRLDHHKKEKRYYKERREAYEEMEEKGKVSEDSRPLYLFYQEEEEYNDKLMSKYQHFLSFLPPDEEYEKEFMELMAYRKKLSRLQAMARDKSMLRMTKENAEDYGIRVYEQRGGGDLLEHPEKMDIRLDAMGKSYVKKEDAFRDHLAEYGLVMEEKEGNVGVVKGARYDFDEVKALDLHHLGYDFPQGITVSKINVDNFVEAAERRYNAFQGAKAYLSATQQLGVLHLPEEDITTMKELADSLKSNPVLSAKAVFGGKDVKRSKTVTLDTDLDSRMKLAVKMQLASTNLTFGE